LKVASPQRQMEQAWATRGVARNGLVQVRYRVPQAQS
jgi:hypothetical protein